jgi:hypothetical protein
MKRNITLRPERLIARKMPKTPRVLRILVTRIGGPNRTIELVLNKGRDVECSVKRWLADWNDWNNSGLRMTVSNFGRSSLSIPRVT